MSKRLVVGNWKMNLLKREARLLAKSIVHGIGGAPSADVVIAPPFTSLSVVHDEIHGTGIGLAAQNVCWEPEGEFTGEISPGMLIDSGCEWVIVGHSERRKHFGETRDMVRRKLEVSLSSGLVPILCVGETMAEREDGRTEEVIRAQVESALEGLEIAPPAGVVIAYEPVWAIGSGNTPSLREIDFANGLIRDILKGIDVGRSEEIRLLYGGSVNENNIEELLSAEIDGVLVGGASIRAGSFVEIIKASGVHY